MGGGDVDGGGRGRTVTASELGAVRPPARALLASFEAGAVLDRFTIREKLGEGGMGIVVAAHDPTLDRAVAIKLLHTRLVTDDRASEPAVRLLREAQAMAGLAHDNVVTVHEVGESDGQFFIVMELVAGGTLTEWLGEPRSWREVIAMFVQAGRALAAAHEHGLVHRDFKPDNVLVTPDGTARVSDFGLVSTESAEVDALGAIMPGRDGVDASPMLQTLTRTGAILGTPRFMSPEQHQGRPCTRKSDQFAFCVALYQALYGQYPFAGETLPELAASVTGEKLRPPPPDSDVPPRLFALLERGVAFDPADRFESMDAVLDELAAVVDASGPRRRSRAWPALAAVAVAAPVAFFGVRGGCQTEDACPDADQEIAKSWNDDQRARITRAFEASTNPAAPEARDRLLARLDTHAAAWTTMHRAACDAHAEQRESASDLALRLECLDGRRRDIDTLVSMVTDDPIEGSVVYSASNAVDALRRIDRCGNLGRLRSAPNLTDPSLRPQVDRIRARLVRVRALERLGRRRDAIALSRELVAKAQALGYAPIEAEAQLELGMTLLNVYPEESVDVLNEAVIVAGRARDDVTMATAMGQLLFVLGTRLGRHDEALALLNVTKSVVARVEDEPFAQWAYHNGLGALYFDVGRIADARVEIEHAKRIAQDLELGMAAGMSHNLGVIAKQEGHLDDATALLTEALATASASSGPRNPETARHAMVLLETQLEVRDLHGVQRSLDHVANVFPGEGPPPDLVPAMQQHVWLVLGESERAIEAHGDRVDELRYDGTTLIQEAAMAAGLAGNYAVLRQWDRALELATIAVEHFPPKLGPHSHGLVHRRHRAKLLAAIGIRDEAAADLAESLTQARERYGDQSAPVLFAHLGWAELHFMGGDTTSALASLDAAESWLPRSWSTRAGLLELRARVLLASDQPREAAAVLDRLEQVLADRASPWFDIRLHALRAEVAMQAGDWDAAAASCARSEEAAASLAPTGRPSLRIARVGIAALCTGRAALGAGDAERAASALERASALLHREPYDALAGYWADFHLARALWSAGDRPRGQRLALDALAAYRSVGNWPHQRRDIERWRAAHRR